MGREVRRVPPNWVHPKMEGWSDGRLQPMFDHSYEETRAEWLEGLAKHKPEECEGCDYWEWYGPPPDRAYHRPWKKEEATWFQLWETVSEGTPVSPPFATAQELADYLAVNGDEWDQLRGHGGWGKKRAEALVKMGWAPSGAMFDGTMLEAKDIPLALEKDKK